MLTNIGISYALDQPQKSLMRAEQFREFGDRTAAANADEIIIDKRPDKWSDVFGNDNPIETEIGFRDGKYLLHLAMQHPEINYVGFELEGLRNEAGSMEFCKHVAQGGLRNLKVIYRNADYGLRQFFPLSSLAAVHIKCPGGGTQNLFPVRELGGVSYFAREIFEFLRPEGQLLIDTDAYPFGVAWKNQFERIPGFQNLYATEENGLHRVTKLEASNGYFITNYGLYSSDEKRLNLWVMKFQKSSASATSASATGTGNVIRKTAAFAVPAAFSATLFWQLVLQPGIPNSLRAAGTVISLISLLLGVKAQKLLQGRISRRNKIATATAVVCVLSIGAVIWHYTAQGADLYHDFRTALTFILEADRKHGTQKPLEIEQQTAIEPGVVYQRAERHVVGLVGTYSDTIHMVRINLNEAGLELFTVEPGKVEFLDQLVKGKSVVAAINGGYYNPTPEGKFSPTGLVIQNDQVLAPYNDNPTEKGSLQAILARTGDKVMIVPSDYYARRLYPFNGNTHIQFAIQAGPLAVFDGKVQKLAEHFYGDGRSLSAIAVDTGGDVYQIVSQGMHGLIGPDYEEAAKFAKDMINNMGKRLDAVMFLDGGGSSGLMFEINGSFINAVRGYHPIANFLAAVPTIEEDPVKYISGLAGSKLKEAVSGLVYLSKKRSPEDFQKILKALKSKNPSGTMRVLSAATKEQLNDFIKRDPDFSRFLAGTAPDKALEVFGISRALPAEQLASNINSVKGLPFRGNVRKELAAALKQYEPDSGLVLLRNLESNTLEWLGGLDSILGLCPDAIIASFASDVPAAAQLISSSKSSRHGKLLIRIGRRSNAGLDLFVRLTEEMRLNHIEYFRLTAQQILLYDNLNVSGKLLTAYYDQYGQASTQSFIAVGLKSNNPTAAKNAAILAERSEKLKPVTQRPTGESTNARAAGVRLSELRNILGLSQEEFGKQIAELFSREGPFDKATVASWESAEVPVPKNIVRITELLVKEAIKAKAKENGFVALIIDENEGERAALARRMEEWGLFVLSAATAQEATEKGYFSYPKLVLIINNTPDHISQEGMPIRQLELNAPDAKIIDFLKDV